MGGTCVLSVLFGDRRRKYSPIRDRDRERERKREREKLSLLSRIEVICDKYSQKRGLGVFVDWSRRLKLL